MRSGVSVTSYQASRPGKIPQRRLMGAFSFQIKLSSLRGQIAGSLCGRLRAPFCKIEMREK